MMESLAYRYGQPMVTGELRTTPEDFMVQELISVQPDGEGEHLWLNLRKRGMNTQFLAKKIAKWAGVKERDVAYAGLKDRHAVTEQWFSVHLPGKTNPDLAELADDEVTVLSASRHSQKLRSAVLLANRFTLTLRNVSDVAWVQERWQQVLQGVPNYFGEQRFGINGGNIEKARKMFQGQRVKRSLQSIYISAVRSLLFNQMVSKRIEQGLANQLIQGDVLKLAGSNSTFVEQGEADLVERLAAGDIELTAPLWGDEPDRLTGQYADWVEGIAAQHPELCEGLHKVRAKLMFRALLLTPQYASLKAEGDQVVVSFMLQPGSFATSVLRELIDYRDVAGELNAHSDQ